MNTELFCSQVNTVVNRAGGTAYAMTDKHALAQYAVTGCFGNTYYASASDQLKDVVALAKKCSPLYVAKVAVYARKAGKMKDMPAVLLAYLASINTDESRMALRLAFPHVCNDVKMVRNFVQAIRSGQFGRKSLGSLPKRLVRDFINGLTGEQLFRQSIGNSPSLSDVIKMVHPRPNDEARKNLYGYLTGNKYDESMLPDSVQAFETYKRNGGDLPDVPFQMLTALTLSGSDWTSIARRATWNQIRQNLNTFNRHGVFADDSAVQLIAGKLADEREVKRSNCFPYQLMMAYLATETVPYQISDALQTAMEHAVQNVPAIDGKVYVFPDVSASMDNSVTGYREAATSKVRCVDVAALVASAVMRKNPTAEVLPFENTVVSLRLNPRDSIMTNARLIADVGGGGTNCSAPLAELNRRNATGDVIIYVSDNESWVDSNQQNSRRRNNATKTMKQWNIFKARNPNAKMICIDIQPNTTAQTVNGNDILNVGGWSDSCFDVISSFIGGDSSRWVNVIESVELI